MRLAMAEGVRSRKIPTAAVLVKPATGEVMARGINNSDYDPTMHSEFACRTDYSRRNGNREWEDGVLYRSALTYCHSQVVTRQPGAAGNARLGADEGRLNPFRRAVRLLMGQGLTTDDRAKDAAQIWECLRSVGPIICLRRC